MIRGRSGSGKSTLLRTMAGFQAPVGGRVRWGLEDCYALKTIDRERLRQRFVGWVDQEYGMVAYLTVQENIFLGLKRSQTRRLLPSLYELASELSISHILSQRPMNISGGERQRAAIVRALIRPSRSIYILDEPTSALDLFSTVKVLNLLTRKCVEGATLVIASHDQEVIHRADCIIELDDERALSEAANK